MPAITYIPQPGSADYAPGADGTRGPFQPGSTQVPDPSKADGTGLGTGSNLLVITSVPDSTYVPDSLKADGEVGTGSNVNFIPSSSNQRITYVPNPNAADGEDGAPAGNDRVTEAGDIRITEGGDIRIVES